jgi:hypothetical protein
LAAQNCTVRWLVALGGAYYNSLDPHSNCGEVSNLSQSEISMNPNKKMQKSTAINEKSKEFTDEERAAMKERAKEMKVEARG